MVTVFDDTPLMLNARETAEPGVTEEGTSAFTWYKPTKPGVSPENSMVGLGKPPIVTVDTRSVFDSGLATVADPVAGVLDNEP
jgi:hypothetical protein